MRGMILLTTVLVLSLLAGLVLSMQRALWLYTKIHQKTAVSHHAFDALEAAAFKLGKNITDLPSKHCFSEVLDANHALRMLKAGHGCVAVENQKKYIFWINQIKSQKKQWIIGVQSADNSTAVILLRFSEQKKLMSWRYLVY